MEVKTYSNAYDVARHNIRKYRLMRGYTQQELADIADLSHGFIRAIESTRVKETFSLDTLDRLAEALEINIKDLFEEP